MPDLSAEYRMAGDWGYVELAGIVREIKWDDTQHDRSISRARHRAGASTSARTSSSRRHVSRLQVVYGEGIENYMNDAPVDVGVKNNLGNPRTPVIGKALPVLGRRRVPRPQLEREVDEHGRLLAGRHRQQRPARPPTHSRRASTRSQLAVLPGENVMLGPEFQWGQRETSRRLHLDDYRIQFSAKYNFKHQLGGK